MPSSHVLQNGTGSTCISAHTRISKRSSCIVWLILDYRKNRIKLPLNFDKDVHAKMIAVLWNELNNFLSRFLCEYIKQNDVMPVFVNLFCFAVHQLKIWSAVAHFICKIKKCVGRIKFLSFYAAHLHCFTEHGLTDTATICSKIYHILSLSTLPPLMILTDDVYS